MPRAGGRLNGCSTRPARGSAPGRSGTDRCCRHPATSAGEPTSASSCGLRSGCAQELALRQLSIRRNGSYARSERFPVNRHGRTECRSDCPGQREYAATRTAATKEGTVPLSDHEQRLLDQIEQALYAEDPSSPRRCARRRSRSRVRRSRRAVHPRRARRPRARPRRPGHRRDRAERVGFVLVVGSCGLGVQSFRTSRSAGIENRPPAASAARAAGLAARMEDRLRRRFDEN